jgi:hypothetical protein
VGRGAIGQALPKSKRPVDNPAISSGSKGLTVNHETLANLLVFNSVIKLNSVFAAKN